MRCCMKSGYIVAIDVDGTTLTSDYQVLTEVRDAIARVRKAGVAVTLATARAPASVVHILDDLGEVDAAICFGGAVTWRGPRRGGVLPELTEPVDPHTVREVVRRCREVGLPLAGYSLETAHVDKLDAMWRREFGHTGMPAVENDLNDLKEPLAKLLVISRPEDVAKLAALKAEFDDSLDCYFSHDTYLEMAQPGVSKGRAVQALARSMGVPPDGIVAIGASGNALPMFRIAGVSVAMGNAPTWVSREADWQTASNDEGGVALALLRCAGMFGWEL
ncbi:MAG: hypothetical protein CL812_06415 [Confluentimicrobium sp.]|nr:hypothetical protein [Actibacterium sp.]